MCGRRARLSLLVLIGGLMFAGPCLALSPQGQPGGVIEFYNNTNKDEVTSPPKANPKFQLLRSAEITEVVTYHWNNGKGAAPGTIELVGNGKHYGPFHAQGSAGQGGAANVNWVAPVSVTLAAGTYSVVDSDIRSWSQNAKSGYRGFVIVRGRYVSAAAAPQTPSPHPASTVAGKSCHSTSGAMMRMAGCSGPVGTTIDLQVLRTLPGPLTEVAFKPGPMGQNSNLRPPPATMQVLVQAGPKGSNGITLMTGDGTSVGSIYTMQAPAQLCMAGRGTWPWDVFIAAAGKPLGDIDYFVVQCP